MINGNEKKVSKIKCPDGNLPLEEMFKSQSIPSSLYEWQCGTQFVKIFKSNQSSDKTIMMFVSMFNDVNQSASTYNILDTATSLTFSKRNLLVKYRIVIRFQDGYPVKKQFIIHMHDISYRIDVQKSNQLKEYILPETHTYNPFKVPIYIPQWKDWLYINTSYLVLCYDMQSHSFDCEFDITEDNVIQCYCAINHDGNIIIIVETIIIWFILTCILIFNWFWGEGTANPEIQLNLNLCMPGQSTHEYLAIFRVGPATDGFDYENSHIDIQLLTTRDEPVGIPMRFSCSKFPDRFFSELHMLICRLSAIPPITAMRINHSDTFNLMYILDFSVISLRDGNLVIQEETIDQFITSDPRLIRLESALLSLSKSCRTSEMSNHTLKPKDQSWFPLIAFTMSWPEIVAFSVFVVGFQSAEVMAARLDLDCYHYWHDFNKSIFQYAVCVISISALTIVLLGLIEWYYLKVIKRYYLRQFHKQMTDNETCSVGRGMIGKTFLLASLYAIGILLSVYTFTMANSLDTQSALIVSGIWLTSLALTFGLWFLIDNSIFAYMNNMRRNIDFRQMIASKPKFHSTVLATSSDKSVLMPLPMSGIGPNGVQYSQISNYGPELTNPKWNSKYQDVNKVGGTFPKSPSSGFRCEQTNRSSHVSQLIDPKQMMLINCSGKATTANNTNQTNKGINYSKNPKTIQLTTLTKSVLKKLVHNKPQTKPIQQLSPNNKMMKQ
ncbi:hypothetical protein RDWZM_004494 [Blomia tropicalis]|uniref:Uncharacterized protein n=1 Tax=Blomia tropicalis TaxID=40697 RepID=A0A9Q0M616_BLOTA|nr:hypothetical protein RDWZM_004494 [Blomia tropicalis]